jgi:UDP-glucose 4-epimerase
MRILVTGGAGFIGGNLVPQLSANTAYDVVVLDNLSAGQPRPVFPRGVRFTCGDFTDKATMKECLQGIDTIIHLAALTGVIDSVEDPRSSFEVNVAGSFQMLELARNANVSRIINASTGGALLGEIAPPISEELAACPLSPYGASKLAVEGYCSAFAGAYGVPCVSLRFSNIYGPRSSHKNSVVAAFIKHIIREEMLVVYGDGTQQRDYLYIGDLAYGIEAALERNLTGVYQLGCGRPTSVRTLIETLKKVSGRDFPVRYEARRSGEVHSTWCNTAKAARDFGYSAPTDLQTGLRATWNWYLENRESWLRQQACSSCD